MNPPNEQHGAVAETVQRIIRAMNLDARVECREEAQDGKNALVVSVYTPEHARFLIGKNGQNLHAFEHVVRAMHAKDNPTTIVVDVNDYRKSRTTRVIEVAKQALARVRSTQRAEALMPMSAYERRVVHMELASMPDIATESVGQEPQRRIVIKPYNPLSQ